MYVCTYVCQGRCHILRLHRITAPLPVASYFVQSHYQFSNEFVALFVVFYLYKILENNVYYLQKLPTLPEEAYGSQNVLLYYVRF